MMFLLYILIILIVLFVFWAIFNQIQKYRAGFIKIFNDGKYEKFPTSDIAVFTNQEENFRLNRSYAKQHGRTYRQWTTGLNIINLIRAPEVEKILLSQKQIVKSKIYDFLIDFLGTGLLISFGEKWLKRRRILTPAFHFNILQQFYVVFKEQSEALKEKIVKQSKIDPEIDLVQLSTDFTLNTLCETAMGQKLTDSKECNDYRKSIHDVGALINYRAVRPWLYSEFMYTLLGHKKKLMDNLIPTHKFTRNVIKSRRTNFLDTFGKEDHFQNDENIYQTKKRRYAMLDTLLAAEKNGEIDEVGIKEEVDTFMFEGHDTTAVGTTFTLFLLAHHPEAQDGILDELKGVEETIGSEDLSMNDVVGMKYLDRVIKECMRLYPPVPFVARKAIEPMDFDGYVLPQGGLINIHFIDLHKDPEQFPDPEKFDPDRFLPENVAKRHPFAYVPFSAGPRNCIGQKFAMLEIKTMILNVLKSFQLVPVTKREDIVFIADLVLRSKYPIKIRFEPKNVN